MFRLYIQLRENARKVSTLDSLPDYDVKDFDSSCAVMDLCQLLEAENIADFVVKGFDKAEGWDTEIYPDLSIVLEEVPQVVSDVSESHYPRIIRFPEQSVQRQIIFEENGDSLTATCVDLSKTPFVEIGKERITEEELRHQLVSLKNDFIKIITAIFPKRSSSQFFNDWCQSFESAQNN